MAIASQSGATAFLRTRAQADGLRIIPSWATPSQRLTQPKAIPRLAFPHRQATAYSVCFLASGERKASTICDFGMPA